MQQINQQEEKDPLNYKLPVFSRKEVHFWRQYETNGEFSNFFDAPFTLKGKIWPTTEHYFQAQKFAGTKKEEIIRLLNTPAETFNMGRERDSNFPLRSDWEQVKEQVMEECCYAKFTQHEYLKQFLLNTGDAKIIEASPRDAYWGWGKDKKGKNRLGIILMNLRNQLKSSIAKINEKNQVLFFQENEQNGQLSNFYPCKFILDDLEWPSTEHYYQAQKFDDIEIKKQIQQQKIPLFAVRFANENKEKQNKNWENDKEYIMYQACLAKFSQSMDLKMFLLSTKDAQIIDQEKNGWGSPEQVNLLGQVLENVRKQLIKLQYQKQNKTIEEEENEN